MSARRKAGSKNGSPGMMMSRKASFLLIACLATIGLHGSTLVGARGDEPAPRLTAAALLTPAQIRGPHHTVADRVRTEGYFHEFRIQSDFGSFDAVGLSMLAVRLREIEALASLQDVSKTEVFLASAGQSVVNVGKGVASVATDPEGTAKGMGAGIKRFGVNLGRQSKRAVDSATGDDPAETEKKGDNAATSTAKGFLGVTKAARRWAQKVGVDPYTTTLVLRKALDDIGQVDAAGSIATKVVLPIPQVVGMTASVGGLVWGKDPEELRKLNEQRLKELGVVGKVAQALFANSAVTLSYETRLIAALYAVKIPGAAGYVATAAASRNEREALFFVESAELLQRWHARSRFTAVLTDSRALVAVAADGRAIVLLPLDWIRWTAATEAELGEIDSRVRSELHAGRLVLALAGKASDMAAKAFAARRWTLVGS